MATIESTAQEKEITEKQNIIVCILWEIDILLPYCLSY